MKKSKGSKRKSKREEERSYVSREMNEELVRRRNIVAEKESQLERLVRLSQLNVEESDMTPSKTNASLIDEVNSVLSELGESPMTFSLDERDDVGEEVSSSSGVEGVVGEEGDGARLKKSGVFVVSELAPVFCYPKSIQVGVPLKDVVVSSSKNGPQEEEEEEEEEEKEEEKEEKEKKEASTVVEETEGAQLNEEEREEVMSRASFVSFFERTSVLMERCLGGISDPVGASLSHFGGGEGGSGGGRNELVVVNEFENRFTRGRAVTCVSWLATKDRVKRDFFCVSYSGGRGDDGTRGGLVIWNRCVPGRCEYLFQSGEGVTACLFYPYEDRGGGVKIVGGTEYGEVFTITNQQQQQQQHKREEEEEEGDQKDDEDGSWRVERSELTYKSHLEGVVGFGVIGNSVSHGLISGSREGVLCEWQKGRLEKEPNSIQLIEGNVGNVGLPSSSSSSSSSSSGEKGKEEKSKDSSSSGSVSSSSSSSVKSVDVGKGSSSSSSSSSSTSQMKELSIECVGAVHDLGGGRGGGDHLFVGGKDGILYSAYLYGTKEGIHERFEGHYGSITCLSLHPLTSFSECCLTSSVDGSVKLWSTKDSSKAIYTFSGFDSYVLCVCWNPVHPAMFVTGDAAGGIQVFDLNQDTDTPIMKMRTQKGEPVNAIAFDPTGKYIAAGDLHGVVTLLKVDDDLVNPKEDQRELFTKSLMKMMNQNELKL